MTLNHFQLVFAVMLEMLQSHVFKRGKLPHLARKLKLAIIVRSENPKQRIFQA
jgi:hypothetical protein